MKKFFGLFIIFIMSSILVNAQTTAPIPSCTCNSIATQLNNGQEIDRQTQKEIEEMDKKANNLDKTKIPPKTHQKHKWFWQK